MATVTKVAGVDVSKVVASVLDATIKRLEMGGVADADVKARVTAVAAHYRKVTPRARLADCDTCGGISDVNEAACPFCGDGEIAGAPKQPTMVTTTLPVVLTTLDLDAAVKRVHAMKADSASSLWELGMEVRSIHTLSIWKLRVNEKGKPAYSTWGSFCEKELQIGPTYAYKLMDVAVAYSREQVRALGAAKLHVTLQVPKEHRKALHDAAQAGASVRQLNAAAAAIGKTKRDTGRTGRGGGARGHAPRASEKITVAALIGRVEIPLMKGGTDKPARNLADVPRGEERLLNGVTQVFVVTKNEDGQWVLVVERVRE
jgi:hypothetical protein